MPKNKVPCRQKSLSLILTISLTTISLLPIPSSLAETNSVPSPSDAPLELELLNKPKSSVITANTIDPRKLTSPSLWLIKANLEENKLLNNWIAYPSAKAEPARRVDLIVNQQVWSLFDYLERYDFVNRFGTAVRNEGYNLRVFNSQEELLATYTCNFKVEKALCGIQMNTQNKLGWRRSL
ncbi:hypothetical protein [Calothrix sp. PCC 7507]|uniref:hypothetical protein n=1 Tax=Calothrix sp. PCC 7507 TaxID=99598 RepID=UPI00029F3BAD|nr:hypothetical protein [Calothrix sp. PCC 7507]AFY32369.1 hypothetical protein Cal7507_1920 [Calothrix sp. PCC 7507]